jgi:hypothetical protein
MTRSDQVAMLVVDAPDEGAGNGSVRAIGSQCTDQDGKSVVGRNVSATEVHDREMFLRPREDGADELQSRREGRLTARCAPVERRCLVIQAVIVDDVTAAAQDRLGCEVEGVRP